MSSILPISSDISLQSFDGRNLFVSRLVKIYRFEPHPNRKEIIVIGDTAISIVDAELKSLDGPRIEDFQKHILLVGLNKLSNVEIVAANILSISPLVELELREKLKETLHEILQRDYDQSGQVVYKQVGHDGTKLPRFPEIFSDSDIDPEDTRYVLDAQPQLDNLDEYIELLYEDTSHKIEATRLIGRLTRCTGYLYKFIKHEALVNAIFRTLREDGKKSSILTQNILSIILDFARFREFHGILLANKIPQLTLDIIDFELDRCERWKLQLQELEETSQPEEDQVVKALRDRRLFSCFDQRVATQNALLKVAFELLHYLSENISVRAILMEQKIVTSLADCLERQDKELLDIVLNYLRDLSCFKEAIHGMIGVDITSKIAEVLKGGFPVPKTAILASLYLLFNIAFNTELRTSIIGNGLISVITKCSQKKMFMKICVKILYLISMGPTWRNKLAKQPLIFPVLDHVTIIPHKKIPVEPGALLVNMALNKRCAEIMAEYPRLTEFIERAIKNEDIVAMKIFRNLAENDFAYALSDSVLEIAKAVRRSTTQDFVAECIGIMACFDASSVGMKSFTENGKIFGWLKQTLALYLEHVEDFPLPVSPEMANSSLDALNFLKTLCKDENGARQVFGDVFAQMFIRILQSSSTDERIHQQILSIFVTATKHNSISIFLAVKTRVPHCLLKFAEEVQDDKLKQLSMSSLENISYTNDTWKELLKQHYFTEWNKEWVKRIGNGEELEDSNGNSCYLGGTSTDAVNLAYYAESSDNSDSSDSESEESNPPPDKFFDMFKQQYDEEMEQQRRKQYFDSIMLRSATADNHSNLDLSDSDTD